MLVNFFEKSDILRFLSTLFLLALLFWKSFFILPPEGFLMNVNFPFFTSTPSYNILLSLLLILLEGVLLFLVSNQFKLIKNDSLLVMVSYLSLIGVFPSLLYFPEFYFLQILFSLFIFLCFYISTRDFFLEILFWASFIIGSLVLIDTIFFLLVFLLFVYFIISDQLKVRNFSILSFGVSLPYILLSSYHFLFYTKYTPVSFAWDNFHFQFDNYHDYVSSFILLFIILYASYKTFERLPRHLILQRQLFLFISLLSISFMIFTLKPNSHIQLYALVPASFLVGKALENFQSKRWKDFYFISLLLFALSRNILNLNFL